MVYKCIGVYHLFAAYSADCSHNVASMVTQLRFLTSLTAKLKDASADGVLQDMAQLRDALTSPDNLRIFMAANVSSLPHPSPLDPWKNFVPSSRYRQLSSITDYDVIGVKSTHYYSCGAG